MPKIGETKAPSAHLVPTHMLCARNKWYTSFADHRLDIN